MSASAMSVPCPAPVSGGKMLVFGAEELLGAAGGEAVAGFPGPGGILPVCVPGIGVVLVRPEEWDRYVNLARGAQALQAAWPAGV